MTPQPVNFGANGFKKLQNEPRDGDAAEHQGIPPALNHPYSVLFVLPSRKQQGVCVSNAALILIGSMPVWQLRQSKVSDGRPEKSMNSIPSSSERSAIASTGASQQSRPTLRPRTKKVKTNNSKVSFEIDVDGIGADSCF